MENDTSTLLLAVHLPTADHECVVQSNTSTVKPPNVADDAAERTTPVDPVPLCQCWNHLTPQLKALRTVKSRMCAEHSLKSAQEEIRIAVETLNTLISSLLPEEDHGGREHVSPTHVSTYRRNITTSLENAALFITLGPGPKCLDAIEIDAGELREHYKTLQKLEEEVAAAMRTLDKDIQEHIRMRDRNGRGLRIARHAIRATSVLSLPYSLLFTSILTAFDTFAMTLLITLSEFASTRTEKESVSKLDALRKECGEKLEQIGRIKDHLEDVKAKGLGDSHDPAVLRRADLLKKVLQAQRMTEAVLGCGPHSSSQGSSHSESPSFRELVAAFRDAVASLDDSSLVMEPSYSLGDERCRVLDERFRAIVHTSSY
ncbi:hypothetical protein C8Q74DRAFT_1310474 [Fomes fomentarius]|nr:hypothetical protein C8Q74DRAFT_1310474 [Fomes fomentarius]